MNVEYLALIMRGSGTVLGTGGTTTTDTNVLNFAYVDIANVDVTPPATSGNAITTESGVDITTEGGTVIITEGP